LVNNPVIEGWARIGDGETVHHMIRQTNQTARTWTVGLAAVLMVAGSGCGAAENESDDDVGQGLVELTVVATEAGRHGGSGTTATGAYAFEIPDVVLAGPARISLVNEGEEPHHAQLFQLNETARVDDLAAALATGDPAAALDHGSFVGGTALVAPGADSDADAVINLEPATYVLMCFVEGPDGRPHLADGMLRPFEVTEAAGVPPPEIVDDGDVELVDYAFDLPDSIRGDALLTIVNGSAAEPHELIVFRPDRGASAGDVRDALLTGTRPDATPLGGMQALLPGGEQRLQLDLDAGEYVVACEIPSPDGTPHNVKGMVQQVTIT
jgi:hypothetical protein